MINFNKYNRNEMLTEEEWDAAINEFMDLCISNGESMDDVLPAVDNLFHETYEEYMNSLSTD